MPANYVHVGVAVTSVTSVTSVLYMGLVVTNGAMGPPLLSQLVAAPPTIDWCITMCLH